MKKEQTRKEKTRKKGKEKEAEKHHLLAKWGSQSLILWPLLLLNLGRFLFYLFVQAAYFASLSKPGTGRMASHAP